MDPSERSLQMRIAAHKSWANTVDRSARTAAARRASHYTRFIAQARKLHPDATEAQIEQIADSLRKEYYTGLALKSAQARRAAGQVRAAEKAKRARQLAGTEGAA